MGMYIDKWCLDHLKKLLLQGHKDLVHMDQVLQHRLDLRKRNLFRTRVHNRDLSEKIDGMCKISCMTVLLLSHILRKERMNE